MKQKNVRCAAAALLASLLMGCAAKQTPPPTAVTTVPAATETTVETAPVTDPITGTDPAADSTAPTEPTPEPDTEDLVRILDYLPDAEIDLRYASSDNFTGQIIYNFEDAYLRYGTLKKLMTASEILNETGYGIKI